jgi:hypothetical protein
MSRKPCACGWIHSAGDVIMVGRFSGFPSFAIRNDLAEELRFFGTRAEAMTAICPIWGAS